MSEAIPEDLMEKAREVAGLVDNTFSVYESSASLNYDAAEKIIAEALLSERKETIERCATEVEARVAPGKMLSIHLAAAIRSLGRE